MKDINGQSCSFPESIFQFEMSSWSLFALDSWKDLVIKVFSLVCGTPHIGSGLQSFDIIVFCFMIILD